MIPTAFRVGLRSLALPARILSRTRPGFNLQCIAFCFFLLAYPEAEGQVATQIQFPARRHFAFIFWQLLPMGFVPPCVRTRYAQLEILWPLHAPLVKRHCVCTRLPIFKLLCPMATPSLFVQHKLARSGLFRTPCTTRSKPTSSWLAHLTSIWSTRTYKLRIEY